MKIYADLPARRSTQLAGDALLVAWILLWAWLGHAVHDAAMRLAVPGHRVESSGAELADKLHGAGDAVNGLPVVGGDVSAPLDKAGSAADQLAEAGRQQVSAAITLSNWLGWTVALIPVLVVLAFYIPARVRFVRRAAAGRALVDSAADLDLFALRALAHQPLHRLATISPDPARAWRERDPDVVRQLAALELAEAGLSPDTVPAQPSP